MPKRTLYRLPGTERRRDVEVHVYGDTAIVEYKLDLTHFAGDVAHLHEIMVWKNGPQGWQMLARHATKLPVAAP
ncbi:MAG: nuclear transport factor 2 family protein [Acidobacteriota bacterium]|nr:nuclear transport factor 2 family protein [Acidobacteriota bacterium]